VGGFVAGAKKVLGSAAKRAEDWAEKYKL